LRTARPISLIIFFNVHNSLNKVFRERKIGKVVRKMGKFEKNWKCYFVNDWANFANLTYLGKYLLCIFAVWVDPAIWMLAKTTVNSSIAYWLKSYLCRSADYIDISIVTDGNRLEAHREGILIKIVIKYLTTQMTFNFIKHGAQLAIST